MSILKHKILACKLAKLRAQIPDPASPNHSQTSASSDISQSTTMENKSESKKRQRIKGSCITPKQYLETKNIVTNFGKAIATFAVSRLAEPYLFSILQKAKENAQDIQLTEFCTFVKQEKGKIGSIDSLRSLMLVEEHDSPRTAACKKAFQTIAEIFIKCFSVSWITHGRVTYKLHHLKFRHKMLRRIKNPELFTYLKRPSEKSESKLLRNADKN